MASSIHQGLYQGLFAFSSYQQILPAGILLLKDLKIEMIGVITQNYSIYAS